MPCVGPGDDHAADWCGRPEFPDGLCYGHRKMQQRGKPLRPLSGQAPPMEAVLEAGSAWLETPAEASDAVYRARRDRFLRACERMMLAQGWRPPEPAGPEQLEAPAERAALAG